jgi:Tfp pilus assembly protein PilX
MSQPPSLSPRRRERGSAYVLVLLSLVILTLIGLSLATVTQLEMEVGSNERSVTRTFYASDSGIAIAVAQALATGEYRSRQIQVLADSFTPQGLSQQVQRGFNVGVSHMIPINPQPCNLCSINENEVNFFRVNHAITSTATELSWTGSATTPPANASIQAQKTISAMIDVQPWFEPLVDSLPTDPQELAKVKF